MQQTQKYKLNLIESTDPFLPEGLNANTQKVEDVLKSMEDGPLAEMDARVTVLEGFKFAFGDQTDAYKETDEANYIRLGFKPKAIVIGGGGTAMYTVLDPYPHASPITIQADGFSVLKYNYNTFRYIAFA